VMELNWPWIRIQQPQKHRVGWFWFMEEFFHFFCGAVLSSTDGCKPLEHYHLITIAITVNVLQRSPCWCIWLILCHCASLLIGKRAIFYCRIEVSTFPTRKCPGVNDRLGSLDKDVVKREFITASILLSMVYISLNVNTESFTMRFK